MLIVTAIAELTHQTAVRDVTTESLYFFFFFWLGCAKFRHCPWPWTPMHPVQVQTLYLTPLLAVEIHLPSDCLGPETSTIFTKPPQQFLHIPQKPIEGVSLPVYSLLLQGHAIAKANRHTDGLSTGL